MDKLWYNQKMEYSALKKKKRKIHYQAVKTLMYGGNLKVYHQVKDANMKRLSNV